MHADLLTGPCGERNLTGSQPRLTVGAAQGAYPAPLPLQAQPYLLTLWGAKTVIVVEPGTEGGWYADRKHTNEEALST
jgi:hypothetical protein